MAKRNESYHYITVESYIPTNTAGLHGPVHIRPVLGEVFSPTLQVECAKSLTENYPVGTRFKLKVKLTDREGGGEYLYSYFGWKAEVIKKPPQPN